MRRIFDIDGRKYRLQLFLHIVTILFVPRVDNISDQRKIMPLTVHFTRVVHKTSAKYTYNIVPHFAPGFNPIIDDFVNLSVRKIQTINPSGE